MSDWHKSWNYALRKQHKEIFDYETKNLRENYSQYTTCPVCHSKDVIPLYEKDLFVWVRCNNCSMVYLNPRLNDSAVHQFYNSSANAIYNVAKFENISESQNLDNKANFENLITINNWRKSEDKGKLLEIGCASGFFLQKAKEFGYEIHGLELNNKNWQFSRDLLGDTILNVDLLEAKYPPEMFDVIYLRDVIAHIPDPEPFLQECYRIIKPGGVLFIDTHNIGGFIHKIVKERHTVLFGFMEPNHFSTSTLTKILSNTGFNVCNIKFSSIDFTIQEILNYFTEPSFTTIFPEKTTRPRSQIFFRLISFPFTRRPLNAVDNKFTPRIANLFCQGSVMKVLAVRR